MRFNKFIVSISFMVLDIYKIFENFDMVPAVVVDRIDCLFHFQAKLSLKHPF